MITAGVIYDRPVLDISLAPSYKLRSQAMQATAVGVWIAIFVQVLELASDTQKFLTYIHCSTGTMEATPRHFLIYLHT